MAFFTHRPDGLIDFTDDSGTTVPMAGYMAEQLQASGVQPQPAPAPPPDMGAPAPAPPMLQLNDPSLQPVAAIPPAGGAPAPEVAPVPVAAPPTDMAPASADPGAVSPTDPVANAPLAGATPIDEETAGRLQSRVDPSTLQFGGTDDSGGYQRPYSGGKGAGPFDPDSIAQLAMSPGGGGGFGLMGRTVQHQAPLTGPHREAVLVADQAQMQSARDSAEANARLIDAQAEARELQNAQEMERQRVRAARVLELQKKRDAAIDEIPKGIDPNAWDKSGGVGRLLAAISIGLGGYASGMTGMQNPGMQILQAAQRDSVEQQREEIRLAEQRGEVADNLYQKALDNFGGDQVAAENMVNLGEAMTMANALQSRIDVAQDDVLRAGLQAQLADVNAQIAQHRAALDGQLGQVADQYGVAQGEDPLDRAIKIATLNEKLRGPEQDSRMEKTYRESQVRLPDSLGGGRAWAKDSQEATDANAIFSSVPDYFANLDELEKLVRENTGTFVSPELRNRIGSIVSRNKLLLKNPEKLGAITAADQDLVGPLAIEGANDLTRYDSSTLAMIQSARDHVNQRLTQTLRTLYSDPQLTAPVRSRAAAGEKAPE